MGSGHPEGWGGQGSRWGPVRLAVTEHRQQEAAVCACAHACANAVASVFSAPKETLRKFQAWGQVKAELAEQKAQAEKEAILAHGGDAFKHLFHQRRRQELEAQKR